MNTKKQGFAKMSIDDHDVAEAVGFLEWDIINGTMYVTRNLKAILGLPLNDDLMTMDDWINRSPEEDIEKTKESINALLTRESTYVVHRKKKTATGEYREFLVHGKLTRCPKSGKALYSTAMCTDITHPKKNKQNTVEKSSINTAVDNLHYLYLKEFSLKILLKEILASFQKITNNAYVSIVIFSEFNTVIECITSNKSSLSKRIFDFLRHVVDLRETQFLMLNNKSCIGIYIPLPYENNCVIYLERDEPFDKYMLFYLDFLIKTVTYAIGMSILSFKEKEKDSIFELVIRQMQTPVAIFDVNMNYLSVSSAWIKEFNLESYECILGKPQSDVMPTQPKQWENNYKNALNGRIYYGEEECYIDTSGNKVWLKSNIHPWYTPNETIGGIVIFSEIITKQKNAEKHLNLLVKELTRSNQELERFAHICSHDLKEPLRSVSGFVQLLLAQNANNFDDVSFTYVPYILKGIDRMNTLIKDILTYSMVSVKSSKSSYTNVEKILIEIKENISTQIRQLKATINIGKMPIVEVDEIQIKQIFTNLIENALKFRSKQHPVIDIYCEDGGNIWEFVVRDNGVGIAPQYRTEIFEIFKRLYNKDRYEGSGVGLSIVKKIVNAHGGEIYVRSNAADGSDFVFTLQKISGGKKIKKQIKHLVNNF